MTVATPSTRARYSLAVFAILCLSGFLCVFRLDHARFWDDEAHIAIVARNFVRTGELSGWDGRNLVGYRDGKFLDENLRSRNAPLDTLLVAASFRVFGVSTFAGRLPFALCGVLACVALTYLLRREWRSRKLVIYALGVFAPGMVLILNARTCRYNALAILFPILAYAAYRRYLARRDWASVLVAAGAFVGLFYASFLFAPLLGFSMIVVALLWHRGAWSRRDWLALFAFVALCLLATVPYVLQHRAWDYPRLGTEPFVARFPTLLWWNLRDLTAVAPNIWLLAVLSLLITPRFRRANANLPTSSARDWTTLCAVYVFALAVVSPTPIALNLNADTRFLLPIAPFLAGLTGWMLWRLGTIAPRFAPLLALFVLCVNVPFPRVGLRFPTSRVPLPEADTPFLLLPAYLGELSQPYPTATDATLDFLRREGEKNQLVMCDASHFALALMFYANDELRIGPQLPPNAKILRSPRGRQLPDYLKFERALPDRLIVHANYEAQLPKLRRFRDDSRAIYKLEATLPVYWNQTQRPELLWHFYGPHRNFNAQHEAVYVYKRE